MPQDFVTADGRVLLFLAAMLFLGATGFGVTIYRTAQESDRDAAPPQRAVLMPSGRVRVTLCSGEQFVVEDGVVFFPNAQRVPSYNTYAGRRVTSLALARQLRWESKDVLEFDCHD